jgi:alcohol dehydrogenase, propanol-preferring
VASLTRQDAFEFHAIAPKIGIKTTTIVYLLEQANAALADLQAGRFPGAALLVPSRGGEDKQLR